MYGEPFSAKLPVVFDADKYKMPKVAVGDTLVAVGGRDLAVVEDAKADPSSYAVAEVARRDRATALTLTFERPVKGEA